MSYPGYSIVEARILALCRDVVGVFDSPGRLSIHFVEGLVFKNKQNA